MGQDRSSKPPSPLSSISKLTEIAYEDAQACPSSKAEAERALERTLLRFWDELLCFYHFPLSSGSPPTPIGPVERVIQELQETT